jgi:hypothetical protein
LARQNNRLMCFCQREGISLAGIIVTPRRCMATT